VTAARAAARAAAMNTTTPRNLCEKAIFELYSCFVGIVGPGERGVQRQDTILQSFAYHNNYRLGTCYLSGPAFSSRLWLRKLRLLLIFAQPLLPKRQDEVRPGIGRCVCSYRFLESSSLTLY